MKTEIRSVGSEWVEDVVGFIETRQRNEVRAHVGRLDHGMVRVDYTFASGETLHRVFTCPADGGAIEEIDHDGKRVPACECLSGGGFPISCELQEALPWAIYAELCALMGGEQVTGP